MMQSLNLLLSVNVSAEMPNDRRAHFAVHCRLSDILLSVFPLLISPNQLDLVLAKHEKKNKESFHCNVTQKKTQKLTSETGALPLSVLIVYTTVCSVLFSFFFLVSEFIIKQLTIRQNV